MQISYPTTTTTIYYTLFNFVLKNFFFFVYKRTKQKKRLRWEKQTFVVVGKLQKIYSRQIKLKKFIFITLKNKRQFFLLEKTKNIIVLILLVFCSFYYFIKVK